MNEDYFIILIFFLGTWAVCFLLLVKLYFPDGLPIGSLEKIFSIEWFPLQQNFLKSTLNWVKLI
jgi:hypothetical protein